MGYKIVSYKLIIMKYKLRTEIYKLTFINYKFRTELNLELWDINTEL